MLTQDTKKHIDAARQILVGVVPNPMSQVEQITNALIYKFMDDMDQQAIKAGGDPSFFVKDLEKYAWTKVMDSRLGNQERMNLYSEALIKFSEAKQLPPLFRDIFKQAFLPYRDPEVLGLFLKEISYFDYTHSEELGNAYEYLLSIMSSQGDAGQFRTPRHIIDFIVDVLAPTKDDTILDPACGTAGFLISAYNYIKRQNEGVDPETGKMRQLTADERRKLVNNFEGYDVDPTMVRMSQVNMYLHKFTTPKIYNYNTLASEDRWNDKFDLILANPPFMSPKGGIKPHNKFSVQANRAEVLFVDYIMNHLKPKGRAGIIVPEGIIFQSGKAYKELRKNLVNDGLFAVVSLPAGVFNPYSGVKTSILFFDNEVAKKTKDLLFVKVTSDGYDLGAQRRKIEKNDLGDTGVILKGFREYVRTDQNKETIESFISESRIGITVTKEKIAETGDYNLSADRYLVAIERLNQKYPLVELKDVAKIDWGNTNLTKSAYVENGEYLAVSATGGDGRISHFEHEKGVTVLSAIGANCGKVFYPNEKFTAIKNTITFTPDREKILPEYLYVVMQKNDLPRRGGAQPFMSKGDVEKYEIPLPPLDVQKEIVEQIEVKQKAIEGAKQVIENLERERRYFGQSLRKLENSKLVKIGEICDFIGGFAFKSELLSKLNNEDKLPVIKIGNLNFDGTLDTENVQYYKFSSDLNKYLIRKGDVLVAMTGATVGKIASSKQDNLLLNQRVGIIRSKTEISQEYIKNLLIGDEFYEYCQNTAGGGAQGNISPTQILSYEIPIVDLENQNNFIDEVNTQQKIIESNKKLIDLMQKKIEQVLSEI